MNLLLRLVFLNFTLFVSSQLIQATPQLKPFGAGTSAICRVALGQMTPQQSRAVSSTYQPRVNTYTGEFDVVDPHTTPAIAAAFAKPGDNISPERIPFIHNLLWVRKKKKFKPNLSALGDPKLTQWAEKGIEVDSYRGEMLFDAKDASAKLSVSFIDSRSLVEPHALPHVRNLASKGDISLIIEDKKGKLKIEDINRWASEMLFDSHLSLVTDETGNNVKDVHNRPYFEVVHTNPKAKYDSPQYAIRIKNLFFDNPNVARLLQHMQQSLAPDEFTTSSLSPIPPSFTSTPFTRQPVESMSADDWNELNDNEVTSGNRDGRKPTERRRERDRERPRQRIRTQDW